MNIIDINELDKVFDSLQEVNKREPEIWKNQILLQLATHNGIEEFRNLAKTKAIIQNFIEANRINTGEDTVEDRVYENAPEFVESLANIVGYYNGK